MCKHCERLVEDAQHKQLVHDFMAVLTAGINRKLKEQGNRYLPVDVNDVEFWTDFKAIARNPISPELQAKINKLLYKDLMDSMA